MTTRLSLLVLLTILNTFSMNLRAADNEWGPLVGPWQREKKPIYRYYQAGGKIVQFQDRYWMILMGGGSGQCASLASSRDGLNWTAPNEIQVILKPEKKWEGSYNLPRTGLVVGDEFWIYYFGKQGIEERIGLATSSDMRTFKKYSGNPIFTKDDSNMPGERVFPGDIVVDGKTVYLFYDIGWDYKHRTHPRDYRIGVASSTDGIHFKDGDQNPVINPGPAGAWDDDYICQASVTRIGSWWYMLYVGMSKKDENKKGQSFGLARATSPAGPWVKYPHNPIFTPTRDGSSWDSDFLQHPSPIQINGQWYLYYVGNHELRYSVGMAKKSTETGDGNN